jgi:hypothetical protein
MRCVFLLSMILGLILLYQKNNINTDICINYDNDDINKRISIFHDKSTIFYMTDLDPESETLNILSPECIFNGSYGDYDCKRYLERCVF